METRLREAKEELFNLRFQMATGQLDNNRRLRTVRHDIARIYTILRERELGLSVAPTSRGYGMSERSEQERSEPAMSLSRARTSAERDAARLRTSHRKTREGRVVSDKMDKTVVVAVEDRVKHSLYGKVIRRTNKLKAHDATNAVTIGDRVLIMETRPLSATKRWRVVEVLEKAK